MAVLYDFSFLKMTNLIKTIGCVKLYKKTEFASAYLIISLNQTKYAFGCVLRKKKFFLRENFIVLFLLIGLRCCTLFWALSLYQITMGNLSYLL